MLLKITQTGVEDKCIKKAIHLKMNSLSSFSHPSKLYDTLKGRGKTEACFLKKVDFGLTSAPYFRNRSQELTALIIM